MTGPFLRDALREVDKMSGIHSAAHNEFCTTIDCETRERWEAEVAAWKTNPENSPDLYEEPRASEFNQKYLIMPADTIEFDSGNISICPAPDRRGGSSRTGRRDAPTTRCISRGVHPGGTRPRRTTVSNSFR